MKEELVSFETAKLARKKGFNIHCDWRYVEEDSKDYHDNATIINWKDYRVKECIDYDKEYVYKAVEYLSDSYFDNFDNKDLGYYCSAPSQSLLAKWLREVHKIHIDTQNVNVPTKGKWMYEINKLPCGILVLWEVKTSPNFDTYEQALEAGLSNALLLI